MVRVWSVIMREVASLICLINIREGGRLRPQDLTHVCLQPPLYASSLTRRREKIQYQGQYQSVP